MRLSVNEALNIMNADSLGRKGYTAENLERGIRQGKFPFGIAIEGDPTDYYPDGKTVYIIESRRLMKWLNGDDIGGTENDI